MDNWCIVHSDSDLVYIKNVTTDGLLGVLENGTIGQVRQDPKMWKQGPPNKEGFFTLEDPDTGKVLTPTGGVTGQGLAIKGKKNPFNHMTFLKSIRFGWMA